VILNVIITVQVLNGVLSVCLLTYHTSGRVFGDVREMFCVAR
jgi:hypothetical protein